MIPDSTTALYFYSAVFQGNMALLALTGIFLLHRLRNQEARIRSVDLTVGNLLHDLVDTPKIKSMLPLAQANSEVTLQALEMGLDIKTYSEDEKKIAREFLASSLVKDLRELRRRHETASGMIKRRFVPSFVLTLAVIILALILLPLNSVLREQCSCFEPFFVFVTIALNIWALWATTSFIWFALDMKETP